MGFTTTRAAVSLFAAVVAAGSLASVAAASCNPGRTPHYSGNVNWFSGWQTGPEYGTVCLIGSRADIFVYSPYVYSDGHSGNNSAAWTMATNNGTGTYAQVGWWQLANGTHQYFDELSNNNGVFLNHTLGTSTVNSTQTFRVSYVNSVQSFNIFINGSLVDTLNNGQYYSGCDAEQFGETLDYNDQMPGGYDSKDLFSSSNVEHTDGTWVNTLDWFPTSAGVSGYPPDFGYSAISSTSLYIWDKKCAY